MRERKFFHFNFLFCCILICYSSSFVVMVNTHTEMQTKNNTHTECVPQMNECFFMWRQLNIFLVYKCFCFFLFFVLKNFVFFCVFVWGWWENGWTSEKLRYDCTKAYTRRGKTEFFLFYFLSLIYHFFCLFVYTYKYIQQRYQEKKNRRRSKKLNEKLYDTHSGCLWPWNDGENNWKWEQ